MKLIRKLVNYLKNRKRKKANEIRMKMIQENTLKLKEQKQSDIARWKNDTELYEDWNERTAILGSYVQPNAKVIEFGAGNMCLKSILPSSCEYTPSDIVKRSENTIVYDLNQPIAFDLSKYDTAIFSGVLEYVYDIDTVFKQLEPYVPHVILSYACSDVCKHNRLVHGWLSDYTKEEISAIFSKYNYSVLNEQEWRQQTIFELRKK